MVEYSKDKAGRARGKTVRTNRVDDESIHYASDYGYDGRGRLVRERILRWDNTLKRMVTTQDIRTTYDLGNNPTQIDFACEYASYTETRTYARGYQLTGFTVTKGNGTLTFYRNGVVVPGTSISGSITYDANNNIAATDGVGVECATPSGSYFLTFRDSWTFTFDGKNRLKTHTHTNASGVVTRLWYDALGRVFQRWPDSSALPSILTRYVYDGSTLVQEHEWGITESEGAYVYTYHHLTRDYLYQPGGIRQRESSDGFTFTDRFLVTDGGPITASTDQGVTTTVNYNELAASGDRQSGGSHWSGKLSNIWLAGSYLEGYGGGTSGAASGFNPLIGAGGWSDLLGLGQAVSGNLTEGTASGFGGFGGGSSGGGGASGNWGNPILPNPVPPQPIRPPDGPHPPKPGIISVVCICSTGVDEKDVTSQLKSTH